MKLFSVRTTRAPEPFHRSRRIFFYPLETFQDGDDVSGQNRSGIRVGCWLLVGPRLDGEIGIFIKFGLSLVD